MQRFERQVVMNGGFDANAASAITGALTLTGALGLTGALTATGDQAITGDLALTGILKLVLQSEEIGGALAVTVAQSLIVFTDADTPASSDITLSTSGHTTGQILYVLNSSATDADVILLAASLVGANPITLAAINEYTVLMWNGTAWLNIGGTAPA